MIQNIQEIKIMYPNEWVLIGNPIMDNDGLEVLSGEALYHSRDKKEVCYLGKEKAQHYKSITLTYTGELPRLRRMTGIFNRITSSNDDL